MGNKNRKGRTKKKKRSNRKLSNHHIIPSSRGGVYDGNIKRVPVCLHEKYHTLFQNLTPDEILEYLYEVWFNPKGVAMTANNWRKAKDERR